MKIIALSLSLIGIAILFLLLFYQNPIIITSCENLSSLEENQKVQIEGKIISEKSYGNSNKIMHLDNNVTLVLACNSCPSFKNQFIQAQGIIEKYNNKIQIKILNIQEYNPLQAK